MDGHDHGRRLFGGLLVAVAVVTTAAGLLTAAPSSAAVDCTWQDPASYVANYDLTATRTSDLTTRPDAGCPADRQITAGQTFTVVAESGTWRYGKNASTGMWGWVSTDVFATGGGGAGGGTGGGGTVRRGCPGNQEMVVVAHADDDIIFMNPTVDRRIGAGRCVVTVYLTAGDAGADQTYWSTRETGARAAHARMQGIPESSWRDASIVINGHRIVIAESTPGSELYFLRLPDGGQASDVLTGPGTQAHGFESLQKLWSNQIGSIHPVDGAGSYTRASLISTLAELIDSYQPSVLHVQDHSNTGARFDHSDHIHAARFATAARLQSSVRPELRDYLGYATSDLDQNVHGADWERKYQVFQRYASADALVHDPIGTGSPLAGSYTHSWLPREYLVGQAEPPVTVLANGFLVGVGGNCLDVVNGGTANQTRLQMYNCVDTPAQRWQLMSDGELRGVGGNCLDVVGGATDNHTQVQMYQCAGVAAQEWVALSDGRLVGVGGNCLDVVNGSTGLHAPVQMYDCAEVAAQRWRFVATAPTLLKVGSIIGVGDNCLDVVGGGTANRTPVQMYDCAPVDAQQWQLMSNGELRGVDGNCLDVVNGGTADQTAVQMYDCTGVAGQRWQLTAAGELRGIAGKCLDVVGGGTANQTRVQLYSCAGVPAQKWRFG